MGQSNSSLKPSKSVSNDPIRGYKPTGLYSDFFWDLKVVKKLVGERKLAPMVKGLDEEQPKSDECPICYLYYPLLNFTQCCDKEICTECLLQIKKPNSLDIECPYCLHAKLKTVFRGPKSEGRRLSELEEQRKVEALQEKMREEERERDAQRIQAISSGQP